MKNIVKNYQNCIMISPTSMDTFVILTFKIKQMPLVTILLVLIAVGVLLWLVNNYLPMDSKIKSILNAVVVIIVVIWLLQAFGVLDSLRSVKI